MLTQTFPNIGAKEETPSKLYYEYHCLTVSSEEHNFYRFSSWRKKSSYLQNQLVKTFSKN